MADNGRDQALWHRGLYADPLHAQEPAVRRALRAVCRVGRVPRQQYA